MERLKKTDLNFSNIFFLLGVIGLALLLCIIGLWEINEPDALFHIKSGEYIWQTASVPRTDPFSFTLAGKEWVNHEWLFQLLTYFVFRYLGFTGLLYLRTLVIFSIFIILFILGIKKCPRNTTVFALFCLIFIISSRFTIRPELFTLLFLSLYLYIILLKPKAIMLLPFIQILWVNVHGYYILGPVIIFVLWITKLVPGSLSSKEIGKTFILALLACAFNPYFFKGLLYPFVALRSIISKDQIFISNISELKRPITPFTLFQGQYLPYKIAVLATITSFILTLRSFKPFLFILWMMAFAASLFANRHLGIFGIISYFALVSNISSLHSRLLKKYRIILSIILVCLIWSAVFKSFFYGMQGYYVFHQRSYKSKFFGVSQTLFPFSAVNFVKAELADANVFNDFNSGSFLVFSLFPGKKVFIDGRTELYGPEFFRRYIEIEKGNRKVIEETFLRYNIDCVFLSSAFNDIEKGILRYVYFSPDWKLVFFDEFASIYVRKTRKYGLLIEKYGIDLNRYRPLSLKIESFPLQRDCPYNYLNRAYIFNTLQLNQAVIQEATQALFIAPGCAQAYNLIGSAYFRDQRLEKALGNFRLAAEFAQNSAEFRNNLGACYGALGLYERAKQEFIRAIKNDYLFKDAYLNLFKAMVALDDKDGAMTVMKKAKKLFPDVNLR